MQQTYDRSYIVGQVLKYRAAMLPATAINCLWRIASHVDLFPLEDLDCTGALSTRQEQAVLAWLKGQGFTV